MSQPPAAPVPYAYPPPPAAPPPPKKKRGCCSCCLWVLLIFVILSVSFVVAAQFIMRTPSNPVKEEYESIPDYFSLLAPESKGSESGNQEIRKRFFNPQSAIRNPQSTQSAIRNSQSEYGTQELRKEIGNPQSAIRNPQSTKSAIRNPQLSGGAHV